MLVLDVAWLVTRYFFHFPKLRSWIGRSVVPVINHDNKIGLSGLLKIIIYTINQTATAVELSCNKSDINHKLKGNCSM